MILIAFGTRPEWIKIEPLVKKIHGNIPYKLLFTGQHLEIIDESVSNYSLEHLSIDKHSNRLDDIVVSILLKSAFVFDDVTHVMVQGDTTSAFAVALAAFHRKIPIIHLEAGLRSFDIDNPYPEEFNRISISNMTSIHLCPTHNNRYNLMKCPGTKYITGNTVLDNLADLNPVIENKVLITMHRRENLDIIDKWFQEFDLIASENTHLEFYLPLHPNPEIQKHRNILKHVKVINPLSHDQCIEFIRTCAIIITDSGGIQEESAFLKKKCIVCRKTTERMEGEGIFSELCHCPSQLKEIFDRSEQVIIEQQCPYGDGRACEKIFKILQQLEDGRQK